MAQGSADGDTGTAPIVADVGSAAGWTEDVDLPQVVKDPPDHNEANWLYGYDATTATGAYLYLTAERDDPQLRRESVMLFLPDGSVLAGSGAGRETRPRVAAGDRLELECVEPWRRWIGRYTAPMQRLVGDELVLGPSRADDPVMASIELDVAIGLAGVGHRGHAGVSSRRRCATTSSTRRRAASRSKVRCTSSAGSGSVATRVVDATTWPATRGTRS